MFYNLDKYSCCSRFVLLRGRIMIHNPLLTHSRNRTLWFMNSLVLDKTQCQHIELSREANHEKNSAYSEKLHLSYSLNIEIYEIGKSSHFFKQRFTNIETALSGCIKYSWTLPVLQTCIWNFPLFDFQNTVDKTARKSDKHDEHRCRGPMRFKALVPCRANISTPHANHTSYLSIFSPHAKF